tara:strand:+ start:2966 stop:3292 length:327 start_codon:yes stop_codon:yes gene_type:complete
MAEPTIFCIKGIGHVPAFKNKKIIVGKRLITAPKAQKWMEEARNSIISQLKFLCQTEGGETSMEHWPQYAMSLLPADDAWRYIPKITVTVRMVRKGDEGAIIKLEKIQ